MNPHRVLIVDDEPLARERLRALLKGDASVEIVGEASNGPDAVAAVKEHQPDIVFLDMQMPGFDGLHVVGELPVERRPQIIFVTAHDKFAVDAFAVHATDYLLKPFDRERLQAALKRAAEQIRARRAGELSERLESLLADAAPGERKPERLAVKVDGRVVFLRPDEIVWAEAADNYVVLHLADNSRLMLRETMSALEERLGSTEFARINRSAIVRLDRIKELQPTFHGDYTVVLRDGSRLPLSRSMRGQLEKLAGHGF
ncbi:MAG TPA: LytTR family DNA-binding domain-containing protein [Candidatus Didemnitutus sp.]|nr:LytTR family DNA-binding domain-containing protein [Candidatus Didemnitutus sp.]